MSLPTLILMVVLLVATLIFNMLVGGLIGHNLKNNMWGGFYWGFWFGPIGWVIVAMGEDRNPRCSSCRGILIDPSAIICPHCHGNLGPEPPQAGALFQRSQLDVDK